MKKCALPIPSLRDASGAVALMVILIAIVGEFSYSMRTELNITRNFKEEEEAYQSALAGIELAKIEILSAQEPYHVYLNDEETLVLGEEEEDEEPVREGEMGKSTYSYTIIDENGKMNINTTTRQQLKNIIRDSGIDITEVDTIVDSIIDWRDTNDLHLLNGAEEDYYQSLDIPYSSKDGPFDIIEELLLIKGVTPEIFYGSTDEEGEEEYTGIAQYFSPWGSRKVNINTASREVLDAVLGTTKADQIMKQRETGPILSALHGGIVTSTIFTVLSTGKNADGTIQRTIKATLRRSREKLEVIYWNDNYIG
jgi:general secretion pathway protein K